MVNKSQVDYQKLQDIVKSSVCANCDRLLVVARKPVENGYVDSLRCSRCGYDPPTKVVKRQTLRGLYLKYGISVLGSLERETLMKQLRVAIRKGDQGAVGLLAKLEMEMDGGLNVVPKL